MEATSCAWLWPTYQDGVSGCAIDGPCGPASACIDIDNRGPGKLNNTSTDPTGSPGCGTMEDARMPELSFGNCSSPGTRQVDDCEGSMPNSPMIINANTSASDHGNGSAPKPKSKPSPPKRKKRQTAMEAYNRGLLFQYLVDAASDLCTGHTDAVDDYETKWRGHQPLASSTWEYPQDGAVDDQGSATSASEQRMMRRRRRRGLLSPIKRNGTRIGVNPTSINKFDGVLAKVNRPPIEVDSHFPDELADPHACPKKKWRPNCDSALNGIHT